MKRTFALMLISLFFLLPVRNRGQKSEPHAAVEHINGIEYVHNTAIPIRPNKTLRFVEDLSINEEDKSGNVILFKPRLAFVDDHEYIYLIENGDQVIKVFGPDGKYIRIIGAKGSGPGEFQTMTYLAITKEGKLVVLDQTTRRTSLFDLSGRFLKSSQWRSDYFRMIALKNSSYIVSQIIYSPDRQFQQLAVKEVDFDGHERLIEGNFTPPEPKIFRQGKYKIYTSPPVSTNSLFAGDENRSWFYHCVNNKYSIDVYDDSGKIFRKIDRPYRPVPFTDKDAQAYRATQANSGNEYIKKAAGEMEMPKIKSIVERMVVDDEGKLWVQTNENKEEAKRILIAFDVFDSGGQYFAKIWTDIIPTIFKKGKAYRMVIDHNTGYQSLKRYKVIWE
jgi:hypothetical protein